MRKKLPFIGAMLFSLCMVLLAGFILLQKTPNLSSQNTKDEITGTWKAEGTNKDNDTWFVIYTFKDGVYTMKTESSYADHGTYEITKRFEDNVSIQMTKTSVPFQTTYDIVLLMNPDKKSLKIDGATFKKQ